MSDWKQNVNTNSSGGSKQALPEGAYTSNAKARNKVGNSLHVIKKLEDKQTKDPELVTQTLLVGSDDESGTAFLKINLKAYWLRDEALALAFGKKQKDGPVFQVEPEAMAEINPVILDKTQQLIEKEAAAKVDATNTPVEVRAEAIDKQIHNILLQIQINVGTIFRLQDWAGIKRNQYGSLHELEGAVFEGIVKHDPTNTGGFSPNVSVFSRPKDQPQARSTATQFQPEELV